jgi:MFS family permease
LKKTNKERRLAVMMALVYAVQGSYWPLLAVHLADLGIAGRGRGWIFATLAIGSLAAPLWAGQVVDRLVPTQRYLAVVYAIGTILLFLLASGAVKGAGWLFAVLLLYWLITAPSYSLSNSLAMRNLDDPGVEFGWVRLWGTAGWMASGWVASLVMTFSGSAAPGRGAFESLWVAAVISMILSVYCLSLPHTPPLATRPSRIRDLWEGLDLARERDIQVLLITSFGVYLTAPVVFQVMPGYLEWRGLPRAWIAPTMTLGQMTEIAMLAALPLLSRRLGIKRTMVIGIMAWFVRFLTLATGPSLGIVVAGTLLQGVGIACFTVGAQVYIDRRSSDHVRATAQGLLLVCTSGLGALLGSVMAGEIGARTHPGDVLVFLIPCVIDGALLVYFLRGFRAPVSSVSWGGAPSADSSSSPWTVGRSVAR